ncbi:hypothetical protein F511_20967 [Dorcoceras hygrometricum]|uniref:Uncharacterized protein n=1 Tax=Dorcoceras hygrometricum TaxID=472368 RepID=A0A2Z7AC82_9LAMI|nr:hypothetical protein F511_20967 [Dorcoceras hygrometricum]
MRTRSDKRPNRNNDRKVLVAEERNKNWTDTDSDSSSSSSSSSDSEQDEFHFLMAKQSSDDEVFDFSNTEFTREDLITALNEMVHEYRKLSQTFEEVKAENIDLKNSSVEPRSVQLENERLNEVMSSWTQSSVSLDNLCETQKPANDRNGLGFNAGERSAGETSTRSHLVYDKFKKMSYVKANVIYDSCESVRYDYQNSLKLNQKGKAGIGYLRLEKSKPSWLKNRLDKDKEKAVSKSFVSHHPRRSSKKVNWSKILFEVLKEMVDRTTKRAKGFAAQICVILKGDPAVTLGEAKTFHPSKIISAKTVNTYFAKNKTIDARGETDEPEVATVAIVKKKFVSNKRPTVVSEDPVVKKKRTTSGKDLAIVPVTLGAEPIQTVDPTSAMPAAHPPAPKRKEPKSKLRMTAGSDDEFVEKESAVETVVVEQRATTSADDVDTIIEEVIAVKRTIL